LVNGESGCIIIICTFLFLKFVVWIHSTNVKICLLLLHVVLIKSSSTWKCQIWWGHILTSFTATSINVNQKLHSSCHLASTWLFTNFLIFTMLGTCRGGHSDGYGRFRPQNLHPNSNRGWRTRAHYRPF